MDDKNIEDLFSGRGVRYRIPIYQRHYVWENNNWRHLWDDLREKTNLFLTVEDVKPHFTGVIVIRGENETREIVDGQQRLTTFQIILCVIRDLCKEAGYEDFIGRIEDLLENKSGSDLEPAENYKLLPTAKSDQEAFKSLVAGNAAEGSGRIQDAYVYFWREIKAYITETKDEDEAKEKILTLRNVFLDSFRVVELPLNPTDEGAKIFEALNGRGRALSQFDHLRNNVFLRAGTAKKRKDLYTHYWEHFNEKDWQSDEVVDPFLENFLKAKLGQDFDNQLPQFDLYQRVYRKQLREKLKLDEDSPKLVEREFKELKWYSDVYAEIINCDQGNSVWFYQLLETTFKITGWLPLILLLKSEKEELRLSDGTLELVLRSLESYIIRCMLYGPKSNLTEPVDGLISLIKDRNNFSIRNIVEHLQERWPTDKQVRGVLGKVGRGKAGGGKRWFTRRFTKYILFQIERMITDHSRSEVVLEFDKKLNIEHIMPENWEKNWALPNSAKSDSEARAQRAERARKRDQHLQSIGNLTLLTAEHNAALGNGDFPEKQKSYEKHSQLKITKKIKDSNTKMWDTPQIQEREANLFKLFCKIWPSAEGVLNHQWQSMITGDDNPKLTVSDDLTLITPTEDASEPRWHSMISGEAHILFTPNNMIELTPTKQSINKVSGMIKARKAILAYSIKDQRLSIRTIQNLEKVQQRDVRDNLLNSYQNSAFHVKVVTRYRHLLNGTIESFDNDAIYMKINAQTVIVYRHNVYTITRD